MIQRHHQIWHHRLGLFMENPSRQTVWGFPSCPHKHVKSFELRDLNRNEYFSKDPIDVLCIFPGSNFSSVPQSHSYVNFSCSKKAVYKFNFTSQSVLTPWNQKNKDGRKIWILTQHPHNKNNDHFNLVCLFIAENFELLNFAAVLFSLLDLLKRQ